MTSPLATILLVIVIGLALFVFPACVISGRISEEERRQESLSRPDFAHNVAGSNEQNEDNNAD